MKTLLSTMILAIAVLSLNAQSVKVGQVTSIINFDSYDIAIVETDAEQVYKSSAYEHGLLNVGKQIKLFFTNDDLEEARAILSNRSTIILKKIGNDITEEDFLGLKFPIVEDGIMHFASKNHADYVYDYIDRLMERSTDEMNDVFDVFELTYTDYVSYRTWWNYEYDWIDGEFTEGELNRIYDREFISDDIHKTFLNEDQLIGIGDKIYLFYGLGTQIEVDKNDQDAIQKLREMPRDGGIRQISSLISKAPKATTFTFHSDRVWLSDTKALIIVNPNLSFRSRVEVENIECSSVSKKLAVFVDRVYGNGTTEAYPTVGGTLYVD